MTESTSVKFSMIHITGIKLNQMKYDQFNLNQMSQLESNVMFKFLLFLLYPFI